MRLVAEIHDLLWVIIDLCVNSQSTDFLPPAILHIIRNFARLVPFVFHAPLVVTWSHRTLQKIHSLVETQLTVGTLKRFLRGGNTRQLEMCKAEMRHALEAFAVCP
jgi:hypothetical protein